MAGWNWAKLCGHGYRNLPAYAEGRDLNGADWGRVVHPDESGA